VIPGHRDGILDIGFGGEDGGLEALGELEGSGGFGGRRWVGDLVRFAVVGRGGSPAPGREGW
jgi:hypothetical protein